ncbi:MAG TPA: SDR family NAD(P)-dependent oxidoreductase, partial [Bacteroidales bacterium]|nr:SDR family NAD(P)-dependent oxidoreductase [Bacteroidales bacterium]
MRKIALITGATAGIGNATALTLAGNNYDVIITGRREERLKDLEQQLKKDTSADVLSLCFDVRKSDQVKKFLGGLNGKWASVDVLVNNAGLASGLNPIDKGDIDDWEKMIDTNIKGLLYVTRLIAPGMVERKQGHIINIGSIAGKEVYENGNVYCATKHAVDALNKGMRIDLADHNVKVTS